MKEEFENWLIAQDDKTSNTAYSYKNAIPKLSKHFSELQSKNIDLFYSNLNTLKKAEQLYSLEGNQSEFGSNSKGINRNAIVALIRFYETFPIKSAKEFYSEISEPDVEEAFKIVDTSRLELQKIRDYAVLNKNNVNKYPPKEIIRIIARNKQVSINEDSLNGGKANAPFKRLKYMIRGDEENINYNASLIEPHIKKYQNAIDNTNWLKIDELYKFKFIKWIDDNIDFKNDSNEVLKKKIQESQQITYSPDSNVKGVNFIQTITRYQDDYLTIDDLNKLRFIIQNDSPVNKENLTLSFRSFPKTSAFLCLFAPKRFMAYDGESLPAYEYFSKGMNENVPKRNFKAFQFYQTFYTNIKRDLKESSLNKDIFREILNVKTLTELHWNFITQDFLLFITRQVMTKNYRTINITGHKIFKCSMGDFLKNKEHKNIDPIELFEKNNLIVMHEYTSNNQGVRFKESLQIGDFVYLTYGQQRLSFLAKVLSEAESVNQIVDVELTDEWICRKIEVIQKPVIDNTFDLKEKKGWLPSGYTTFKEIFDINSANQILFNKYYNIEIIDENKTLKQNESHMNIKNQPLNQILYGPPGTGKTYKTKKIAVEIIENVEYSDSKEDRAVILEKYEDYVASENIHFTTFHQSMSYEDFIEGIKPETADNQVTYDVQDGIFKEICDKAKVKQESNFDEAYQSLLLEIIENPNDYIVLNTPTGKEFRINVNSNNNLNLFTSKEIKKQGTVTKEKLLKQINGFEVFNGWEGYVNGIVEYLKSKHHLVTSFKEEKKQNYVLIIDEINRGNVSAIFGELITLIETDKREGEDEAISVTLPYSQSSFSVPNNVFIIGTMNTADRSVEALDTALRRRFSFEEVLPKPNLLADLDYKEINLEMLLFTINQRIELLIDKDHQIGHSYFFNVTSLEDLILVFKDKIIPLLEEYFYGDFGKIGLVLGDNFIVKQATKNKSILAKFDDYTEIDFVTDKSIFRLKKPIVDMQVSDFTAIYQPNEN
tara:strand:- start:21647 stop:24637 length:2991 start_codon:yes stop_codon:yes gene_type:complete